MTEEAVLHTELKMKRLLLEEDIWQHRRELLEDGLPGSKKKYQQGDWATSLLSLTHSYAGRTQDFTLVNQLFGHCVWKHWNEEGHMASDWFLGELLVSNLFPSALPCARDSGWNVPIGRLFPSIAPSLQTSQCSSGQEHRAGSWQPPSISSWPLGTEWTHTLPGRFHQCFVKGTAKKVIFSLK